MMKRLADAFGPEETERPAASEEIEILDDDTSCGDEDIEDACNVGIKENESSEDGSAVESIGKVKLVNVLESKPLLVETIVLDALEKITEGETFRGLTEDDVQDAAQEKAITGPVPLATYKITSHKLMVHGRMTLTDQNG